MQGETRWEGIQEKKVGQEPGGPLVLLVMVLRGFSVQAFRRAHAPHSEMNKQVLSQGSKPLGARGTEERRPGEGFQGSLSSLVFSEGSCKTESRPNLLCKPALGTGSNIPSQRSYLLPPQARQGGSPWIYPVDASNRPGKCFQVRGRRSELPPLTRWSRCLLFHHKNREFLIIHFGSLD